MTGIDLDRPWRLHPQVAVRPEPFGALLYHFGTRRLSFVKDPTLLRVLECLPEAASARAACVRVGAAGHDLPRYERALSALAHSDMLIERAS